LDTLIEADSKPTTVLKPNIGKGIRVLQLCKKFPYPLKNGESIAVTYLSRAMKDLGCEITLLSMNTSKYYFDVNQLPTDFKHYKAIHTTELNNEISPIQAFKNLFTRRSFHIDRYTCDIFSEKLIQVLSKNNFDVIQLETLYLAPYIPLIRKHCDAKIVMRSHNVEFEIWERIAHNTFNPLKKFYIKLLAKRLKRYEIEHINDWDYLLAISERDLKNYQNLGLKKGGTVIPIGLDFASYSPDYSCFKQPLSISFIGSLDWRPNIEALEWFMDSIWSHISHKLTGVVFHIAGRNTPEWLFNLHDQSIQVHGEVESSVDFINKHPLMVVPILSAGGMRAKILEGMALGKVILTTSMGMEGINAQHREHILVADTAEEFEKQLIWASKHTEELKAIGENARKFVLENFDNHYFAQKVCEHYLKLMQK